MQLNKVGAVAISFVGSTVAFALWIVLLYMILDHINASPLMWGLFWGYAPLVLIVTSITKWLATRVTKEDK